jgi:hypothetical protein
VAIVTLYPKLSYIAFLPYPGGQIWVQFPSHVRELELTDIVQNDSHICECFLSYRYTKSWNEARTWITGVTSLLLWRTSCINCGNLRNRAHMKQVLHSTIPLVEQWSMSAVKRKVNVSP